MIEQYTKLRACDVVPAARKQNRFGNNSSTQELFKTAREVSELSTAIRHLLHAVALVRHGFDFIAVVILEDAQDVGAGIVEPGIAFRHEDADTSRTSNGAQPAGWH